MNNIDPIQEELAQAGEASPITPELILLDQKSRITSESEIEDEEFLFRFMGEKCFPRKDLTTITGPAKGGKTFFSSLLMACSTKDAEGALLHLERIRQEPLKVMWYDTEQSKHTTKKILVKRISRMIGIKVLQTKILSVEMSTSRNTNLEEKLYYTVNNQGIPVVTEKPDIQQRDPNGKFTCKDSTSETANNFNREYTIHLPDSEWTWDFRKDKRPLRPRCYRHAPSMSYPPSIHALPSIKREGYSMRGCSY